MLSSLDFSIVVFVAESRGCNKQALLDSEKSPAVINQNHSEEVKRLVYKEHLIHTTFSNHYNWLFRLLYVHLLASRFLTEEYNKFSEFRFEANFINVFCDKIVCVPLIPQQKN